MYIPVPHVNPSPDLCFNTGRRTCHHPVSTKPQRKIHPRTSIASANTGCTLYVQDEGRHPLSTPTDSPADRGAKPPATTRDARLNLRANSAQLEKIRRAADTKHTSVTDFVLDSASIAADQVLADRRWFQVDAVAWSDFQVLLERPVVYKPRLAALLAQDDPFHD